MMAVRRVAEAPGHSGGLIQAQLAPIFGRHAGFVSFLIVGVLNTAFGYGVFALLLWLGAHYTVAAAGSTVLGVLFNFRTTGRLVFGSRDDGKLLVFVLVYLVVYGVQIACLSVLIAAGLSSYVAGIVLILPIALLSFFLLKRFVFLPV